MGFHVPDDGTAHKRTSQVIDWVGLGANSVQICYRNCIVGLHIRPPPKLKPTLILFYFSRDFSYRSSMVSELDQGTWLCQTNLENKGRNIIPWLWECVGWPRDGVSCLGKVAVGLRKGLGCLVKVSDGLRVESVVSDGLGKVLGGLGNVLDGLGKVSDGIGKVSDGLEKVLL